jgi:hypothetical protein
MSRHFTLNVSTSHGRDPLSVQNSSYGFYSDYKSFTASYKGRVFHAWEINFWVSI